MRPTSAVRTVPSTRTAREVSGECLARTVFTATEVTPVARIGRIYQGLIAQPYPGIIEGPPSSIRPPARFNARTSASTGAFTTASTSASTSARPVDAAAPAITPGTQSQDAPAWISRAHLVQQTYPPGLLGDPARRQRREHEEAYRTAAWGAHLVYRRELRERTTHSPAATRIRRPGQRRSEGYRSQVACSAEDLYYTADVPPVESTDRTHQKCGICLQVKSHPVW